MNLKTNQQQKIDTDAPAACSKYRTFVVKSNYPVFFLEIDIKLFQAHCFMHDF
jgi:hypothetical protein